jgi:hypothetical protein
MDNRTHHTDTTPGRRGRTRLRVGLLTDPGVPAQLAADLAPALPAVLAAEVHDGTEWDVATEVQQIPLDDDGRVPMESLVQQHTHLALVGLRGRLRLLAGMVRDNRPWRLVPHLSSATAAAAATGAYAIITSSFWPMSASLSPLRLLLINLVAILAMATWLIAYNHLWDRPDDADAQAKAVLYNAATAFTITIGVACMYVLLYLAGLCAALTLIDPDYFAATLHRPAVLPDYLKLVWLGSSIGIVAGALGSSLESEEAVHDATYGRRERQRRRGNGTQ